MKLNKQDAASMHAVELMDKLFLIDAQAREEKMDHAARHLLRQEKAPPLLKAIRHHILATGKTVLPSSNAGQACELHPGPVEKAVLFLEYPNWSCRTTLPRTRCGP